MSFYPFGFISGLAYLALCLLTAGACAWRKCHHLHQASQEAAEDLSANSTIDQLARKSGLPPVFPLLLSLSISGLIALLSFLFMPCGTLPAFSAASHASLAVLAGLFVSLGTQAAACGWATLRCRWLVPSCLGVSMVAMAQYAEQRGIPGGLYALDTYVAMPLMAVADGRERLGMGMLALASLLALWKAAPARPAVKNEYGSDEMDRVFFKAWVSQLWMLAAIGFWVCLFFPFQLVPDAGTGMYVLGSFAANAFLFWGKLLALNWLLGWFKEVGLRIVPFLAPVLSVLVCAGAWLLFSTEIGQ